MTDPHARDDRDLEQDDNAEQRDADQAQDVADDALTAGDDASALDSSKAEGGISDDDSDVHDTVDMMKQMVSSGRIDMGAYAGEPLMDDGDEAMPGTPPGPMPGSEDDVMGTSADPMDAFADEGDDPLAAMVSNDDGDDDSENISEAS